MVLRLSILWARCAANAIEAGDLVLAESILHELEIAFELELENIESLW